MAVGGTLAVALEGLRGALVEVEASITSGLPWFGIVGLPDTALRQAEHRVRAAASHTGVSLNQDRIVVNLSPAVLPKHGSGFDLAIALSCLAAAGKVERESVASAAHLGELGLDGRLRPVLGVLPAVHAAARAGVRRILVPSGNLEEAQLVPGIEVVPVASLREAAIRHGGDFEPVPVEPVRFSSALGHERAEPELSDIVANAEAVEALIAAAAGGHHLYFLGPPGAGKTMLAERLPGLLPDLDEQASLEATSIRSLTDLGAVRRLVDRPPFEAPHHTASAAALVGGGSGRIRPGAAVRASHGILFLDEAPEFQRAALDALRQPLESGRVTIIRANARAEYPARFQLVLAANPCPCGHWGEPDAECVCQPNRRRLYLARLSGPLLDRIDIQLRVPRLTTAQLRRSEESRAISTAAARLRVAEARGAARERLAGTPWTSNSQLPGTWLDDRRNKPSAEVLRPLERALDQGVLSARGYHRTLRLAWTLADLAGRSGPGLDEVGRALLLRQGATA